MAGKPGGLEAGKWKDEDGFRCSVFGTRRGRKGIGRKAWGRAHGAGGRGHGAGGRGHGGSAMGVLFSMFEARAKKVAAGFIPTLFRDDVPLIRGSLVGTAVCVKVGRIVVIKKHFDGNTIVLEDRCVIPRQRGCKAGIEAEKVGRSADLRL